jgi:hypothetical protein
MSEKEGSRPDLLERTTIGSADRAVEGGYFSPRYVLWYHEHFEEAMAFFYPALAERQMAEDRRWLSLKP